MVNPWPPDQAQETDGPVVFLAPGAGLGHLVRTGALGLGLRREGIRSIILSSSAWSRGFAAITGLDLRYIPLALWKERCLEFLRALAPRLIVQDSFPLGLRGENLESISTDCPRVCLARHLKLQAYVDAIKKFGPVSQPHGLINIIIEPLALDHEKWLGMNNSVCINLDSRIRFPVSMISVPEIPEALGRQLDTGFLHLVVHSGPEHEVNQLIQKAEKDITDSGKGELAVINPVFAAKGHPHCYDYFPAAGLYAKAFRIYTGGGYNSVAEGSGLKEKHVMIPFPRHYDDQVFRVNQSSFGEGEPSNDRVVQILKHMVEHKTGSRGEPRMSISV
ncbi:MAG: hypothetical protein KKD44_17525 [Proteobacteria bacterium]|nr:hypothetical protein [Pseudomonadota bacterium]